MFTLYTTPLSANGRKVLALCHQLGLRPAIELVNVYRGEGRRPAYLAINPLGKIPTLVDGGFTLFESNAILVYIAETHGDFRLWSREPRERAEILRWLFWEASHWQPALSAVLAPLVGHRLLPSVLPAPSGEPDWQNPQLLAASTFLDSQLEGREFLSGSKPTLADFCVGGMTTYFRAAKFPLERFAKLRAWYDRLQALDAWQASADPLWE